MQISKTYLVDAYEVKELSIYEIAEMLQTYPNKIRRLLIKYGIKLRSKSEAQAIAIKQERHKHPTKGTKRSDETKQKISKKMKLYYKTIEVNQ